MNNDYGWHNIPRPQKNSKPQKKRVTPSKPINYGLITQEDIESCDLDLLARQLQF